MSEIYVSTDVEADGPIPGPHSMLSLGSAAYREDSGIRFSFCVLVPDAIRRPKPVQLCRTGSEDNGDGDAGERIPALYEEEYAGTLVR